MKTNDGTFPKAPAMSAPKAALDTGGQGPGGADTAAIVARAEGLDLGGDFVLPPGDPISHFGAGFAKILASNIFLTGLEPDFAAEHVGYFTAPYGLRGHVVDINVDHENRAVHVKLDNGVTRSARIFGSQGAVALPLGADDVFFTPSIITPDLPPPEKLPWPLGDLTEGGNLGGSLDDDKLDEVLDLAFAEDSMTAAFVVTHHGKIIAERYQDGLGIHTPLESWSMGKSMTATLLGILIQEGVYDLWQPAPIPQWQENGDPRAAIRIGDILQMSSGLRFRAMQDPGYDPDLGYPDHLYVYTGGINAFEFAASRSRQWPAGQVGRYRNVDPVLANYLIRLAVEGRGEDYHSFPQRALFDKLGMRDTIIEPDPHGNFLMQGYEFASARDWARLGQLYLDDGICNGARLLPEGWVDFVSTLAPGWQADNRPIYGGFFWLNGDGQWPLPRETFFMSGAGGQKTFIIPSHDLVVVRLGHYSGFEASQMSLSQALAKLMQAIPASG